MFEDIVETVREPLVVLDRDLRVLSANRSFYDVFKVRPNETIGTLIYDLGNQQWDIAKLRTLLEEILPRNNNFNDYEVEHTFPSIGRKIMLLNARHIINKETDSQTILLAIEDITERRRLENELKDYEERFRRLFETAKDGLLLIDKQTETIVNVNPAIVELLGYSSRELIGKKLKDIGLLKYTADFKETIDAINQYGFVIYDSVMAENKQGHHINVDIHLVDRARFIQCNVRDITERKASESKLLNMMNEQQIILDTSNVSIWKMVNRKPVWINQKTVELFQYSNEELIGQDSRKLYPSQEAYEKLGQEAYPVLARGGGFTSEQQLIRKDGTEIWVRYNGKAIDPSDMSKGVIWILEDVTDKKHAELQTLRSLKEKESLLREIHHRVKNNMAVISSLLALQARKIDDATFRQLLGESQQRIKSMALVHEKLYQTKDFSSINFEDYIKSLISEIVSLHRIDTNIVTTEINIKDVDLDLDTAVPCGLIINELLTNAFKYAFANNRKGVLSINFTKADQTYTLSIKDNGVGLPEGFDYKEANSLGLQLVNALTGQINGTLEVNSDKGTEVIITFNTKSK